MKVSYMKKRYRKMMTGADGANLERMLIGHLNEIQAVSEENAAIKRENERLDGLLQLAITRVGVVRFRAFDDMGSDLSYALHSSTPTTTASSSRASSAARIRAATSSRSRRASRPTS